MDGKRPKRQDLVLESSLQSFFFECLSEVNGKALHPLPNEIIYYSSVVMDRFGESKNYFQESKGGRLKEKLLGKKLLESTLLPRGKQINELKDIGDTALFLCGYFSDSLNRKLVDTNYYRQIGQSSYKKLNAFLPTVFEFENFYIFIAKSFVNLAAMMSIVAQRFISQRDDEFTLLISSEFKVKAS